MPSRVLGNFQVTYSFCPHSVSLGVHSASNRNKNQRISLGWCTASAYSCQLCHPSCAEYQSKNGCPTFHFPSESSQLVMGNLPLQCLKSGFCDSSSHCLDSTIFLTIFGTYRNMVNPQCWPWCTVWAFNPSHANGLCAPYGHECSSGYYQFKIPPFLAVVGN